MGTPASADSAHFTLCGSGPRVTCVVDGDTIWLRGTKIRLERFDAPEKEKPQCTQEAIMSADATRRLMDLLNGGEFEVTRRGNQDADRYGRKLRTIEVGGQSVGDILIAEGLARH